MARNDTVPNTCIDMHRQGRTDYVGLYRIWPTFGGGYIVTTHIDGNVTCDRYEAEADARRSFDGWVDALAAQTEYRNEADTLATLRQF